MWWFCNTQRTKENMWDYGFRILLHYMHEINLLLAVQEGKKKEEKFNLTEIFSQLEAF